MALRRIYDDASFTLPAVTDAVVDGSLTVESKSEIAPSTANLIVSATGQSGFVNVAKMTQAIQGDGGGIVNGVIATRFVGGADYGVSLSVGGPTPNNQFVVSTNGCVGIGKDPLSYAPGSLDISSGLYLDSAVGQVTATGATPVVVANTLVTANSKVFFSLHTVGGTVGFPTVSARVPGTSFSVISTNALDTSVYDYLIIN